MSENLVIERLSKKYLKDVFEIEQSLIGTGSVEDIEKTIYSDTLSYFVLLDGEQVLGFLELSVVVPEIELFDIAIARQFQGNGYANVLMEFMIDYSKQNNCNTIFLEVNKINIKAISLYKKFGFKQYAERKNYYGDNDAVLMKLQNF